MKKTYFFYTASAGKNLDFVSDEEAIKAAQADTTIVRVIAAKGSKKIYERDNSGNVAEGG